MSVEHTAMFDVSSAISELRSRQSDCGWLLLIDGRHKFSDHELANGADLLQRGISAVS